MNARYIAGEGNGMKRWSGGHRKLQLDGEQMAAAGSKIVVQLCFKKWCGNWDRCYCCEMKPNYLPCFTEQQKCWDACPGVPPRPAVDPFFGVSLAGVAIFSP
jgi:hypothetical protein